VTRYRYLEPQAGIDRIRREWGTCTRCSLCETRFGDPVLGEGAPDARLAFVGEAPGVTEEERARPFVGRSGNLFRDVLSILDIPESRVWITNSVLCRPPDFDNPQRNRQPTAEELKACRPRLHQELYAIDPDLVVAMGAIATRALGGTACGFTQFLGDIYDFKIPKPDKGFLVKPMLVTWHPAYILRKLPTNDPGDFYPKTDRDIRNLPFSENPLHQFMWHIMSALAAVLYKKAIHEQASELPEVVRDVLNIIPYGDSE
jgi:uracil-DNA glycosylase